MTGMALINNPDNITIRLLRDSHCHIEIPLSDLASYWELKVKEL